MGIITDCYTPFRTRAHFRRFYETIAHISSTGQVPLLIQILKLCYLFVTVKHLFLYFAPISASARFYLQDFAFIFGTGSEFNLIISTVMIGNCYYVVNLLYVRAGSSDYSRLPFKVMFGGDLHRFFMKSYTVSGKVSISKMIEFECFVMSNGAIVFITLATHMGTMIAQLLIVSILKLAGCEPFWSTFLRTALMEANLMAISFGGTIFGTAYTWSVVLPVLVTHIQFIRFGQANHLLLCAIGELQNNKSNILASKVALKDSSWKRKIMNAYQLSSVFLKLERFYRFHTACLWSTFSINRIYGPQLLVLLLYSTPVNTYIIMSILMNRLPKISLPFMIICLLCQIMYIFFMHLLAVCYPQRIHRTAKLLLQVSTCIKSFTISHMKDHIRLALSIDKLYTRNRYGITYGKLQLVTMATFFKFLLFYNKFMIFSYKLNKRQMENQ